MERLQIAVEEWELYTNGILLCKWFDSDTNIKTINEFVKEAYNTPNCQDNLF
ncbi:hypothetical protein B0F89_1581 [Malaciobacter marinus]|uniref:Uncharacterized protein n=1 Tax=Malaciobacter marinus TaxID=505249 RepID=A0AB36ZSJ5_9BACT|nr:hypothetical protein [Malaciobacter marinus]PPK57008.1 hypothetical protein B0F89_1581 [Malaciobacter marinus]